MNLDHKYGSYTPEQGWAIRRQCAVDMAHLQVYHLIERLRGGHRPVECTPQPPPGRTLVEFSAAAWTPLHSYHRDRSVPGHHREPRWLAFTAALEDRLNRGAALPIGDLAERVYGELVSPLIEAALEKERATWEDPEPFGAFRYDGSPGDPYVALHIHNAYQPRSLFEKPEALARSLAAIIADIDRRGLKVTRIGVDSWLNSLPAFQALFPPSFTAILIPTDPDNKGGNGWWGQYIARTGKLNEQRAQRLRQTGRFDIVRTHGECAFEDFREHVERLSADGKAG